MENGISFPADASGKRSTIAGGKAIFSAAARAVDQRCAEQIEVETNCTHSRPCEPCVPCDSMYCYAAEPVHHVDLGCLQ